MEAMVEPGGDHITATRYHWTLKPKHKVFLSHSGARKGFVEQLCLDLERCGRFPFFYKRRESLPHGESFLPLISEAIQQCQVGVVFLTEEFFSSKWPMLELVEMVKTHIKNPRSMKLMPIFLDISSEDLHSEVKCHQWISKWHDWAETDERIHVEEWKEVLQLLRSIKGLVYNHGVGIVKFREEIVEEICHVIPPFSRWDDSHVQGKSRLCKVIWNKIVSTPMSQTYKVQVVGLYGVGGIGKTTACKTLCNDLRKSFGGRTYHIEFDNFKAPIKRMQEVLKKFTNTKHEFLKDLNMDECWNRLKKVMQAQRVFLAIDNVSCTSAIMEEAKKYLEVRYAHGSVLLVASCSLDILKDLRLDDRSCFPMPELEADEARALFLYSVAAKIEVNEEIILRCLKRCYFCKRDGRSYHYHPLALKVLGSQLQTEDFEEWVLQLNEVDTFNQYREKENPIFSILRRRFDNLLPEDQLLFVDVVIFNSTTIDLKYHYHLNYDFSKWLSMVHGISIGDIMMRLKGLKRKSLLENLGDGSARIGVHDLWREFAMMETKAGEIESGRWVDERLADAEDSSLADGGWENLQRISITTKVGLWRVYEKVVERLNFTSCTKLTVLRLVHVTVANNELDLSALKQLKSLELCFVSTGGCRSPTVSGIGALTKLAVLLWLGASVDSLSAVEEIADLTNLQVLFLTCNVDKGVPTTLYLGRLSLLRRAKIEFIGGKFTISGLSSKMTKFRNLDLKGYSSRDSSLLRSFSGLDDVLGLEVLDIHAGQDLEALPNLERLTNLRVLKIQGCDSLIALAGLGSLVALQELRVTSCNDFAVLPDISKLTNLQLLDLQNCPSLVHISGLENLISLQEFIASFKLLEEWPDLLKLSKLRNVHFFEDWVDFRVEFLSNWKDIHKLNMFRPVRHHELIILSELSRLRELKITSRDTKTLSGLSYLAALRSFQLLECVNLERLPDMGKHMRLKSLKILKCYGLKGWDGVGGLMSESQTGVNLHSDCTLPHLEVLKWKDSPVIELPDLSIFPQLRVLKLRIKDHLTPSSSSDFFLRCRANHLHLEVLRCTNWPIKRLPNLRKFLCLKELKIEDCNRIHSLTSSGPLTALKTLHLRRCTSLEVLANVALFPCLTDFTLEKCGVKFTPREVVNLHARCWPRFDVDDAFHSSLLKHICSGSSVSGSLFDNEDYEPILYDDTISGSESIPYGGFILASDADRDSGVIAPKETNNHLEGQSSLEVEPSTSEFIPYSEPNDELGVFRPPGPKEDLPLVSLNSS